MINIITIIGLGYFFNYIFVICKWRKNNLFHWFGIYTLELYIIHLLIYYLLNNIENTMNTGTHMLIGVVVAILCSMPIHNIINKVLNK